MITIMVFERFQVLPAKSSLEDHISRLIPKSVARRLQQLLKSSDACAQTAVIEKDYIDVDYSASYYEQRGRSFTPDKRGTTRIHFFTEGVQQTFIDKR